MSRNQRFSSPPTMVLLGTGHFEQSLNLVTILHHPDSHPVVAPSQCIPQYKTSYFKHNSVTREGRRENNYFSETLPDIFKQFSVPLHKKQFFIKDFFINLLQFPADLVTFIEEILNEKLCFLCSGS